MSHHCSRVNGGAPSSCAALPSPSLPWTSLASASLSSASAGMQRDLRCRGATGSMMQRCNSLDGEGMQRIARCGNATGLSMPECVEGPSLGTSKCCYTMLQFFPPKGDGNRARHPHFPLASRAYRLTAPAPPGCSFTIKSGIAPCKRAARRVRATKGPSHGNLQSRL